MRIAGSLIVAAFIASSCALPFPTTAATPAPPGTLLLQDDFSTTASGWPRIQNDGGIMDYDGSGYRILVTAKDSSVWSTLAKTYRDARIEVDAGKLGGSDANRVGLVCRADNTRHYFFIIGSDGYYGLGVYSDGKAALLGQAAMQPSDAITIGTAVNHLRLDCKADTLTGYVNGVQVATVQDETIQDGQVGVLAGTFDEPGADIVFDNFAVLQP